MQPVLYILAASVCLAVFYITYRIISKDTMNFRHARLYLLASIAISLLIPLTDYRIETGLNWSGETNDVVMLQVKSETKHETEAAIPDLNLWKRLATTDPLLIITGIYILVSGLLLIRVLLVLALLINGYRKAIKVRLPDYILLYDHGYRNTFSFFRWIFVYPHSTSDEDIEPIIAHEKIHVIQYHSFDVILIELLTAVMWFNPFVWMMKNSMQLVHEYLADDGALDTGINRFKYQALLINQIAEERLVVLSSSFNHSLIKKRITMMTNTRIQRKSLLKLLVLFPAATLVFLLMSMYNGVSADVPSSETATFSMVNTGAMPDASLPPDTIIKKTITKKISKDNPTDTLIEEKTEVITGEDALKEFDIVEHSDGGVNHVIVIRDGDGTTEHRRNGERREVRVHSIDGDEHHTEVKHENRYTVHVIDGEAVVETIDEDGDSVKHVKIVTKRSGDIAHTDKELSHTDMELSKDKKIVIRHTGDKKEDILYIVDGVKYTDEEFIKTIDPDNIESMNVVKGEDVRKYSNGDYEGVIIITSKKGKKK